MAFSTLTGTLLLVASLFVIYPFMIGRSSKHASSQDQPSGGMQAANVAIFREQEAQLQRQLDNGEITQSQYQQLQGDAQQLLLANTNPEQPDSVAIKNSSGLWLLPLLVLSMAVATLATYSKLGAIADEEILELIAQGSDFADNSPAAKGWRLTLNDAILQRVRERPDNIYYWAMLAQGALAEGDMLSASQYFAAAVEVQPEDGFLLAQYAESLYLAEGNRFNETVTSAMDRAFTVDSNNSTILGLKGIQSFENGELKLAITYWQGAMQGLDANSPTAKALQMGVDRANSLLGITAAKATEPRFVINILVSLDPNIAFKPEQMVFVAAVPSSGSPMPLAAKKLTAADLPALVALTDQQALMAEQNLSSVDSVKLVARLSASGSATPQPGDWEMVSDVIQLNAIDGQIELQISSQRQ
ncbi:MAG: c-type cytochrome biogenesis protein CcmI [Porticoccaceae bacterium]|nr:c-type cytochrome biogenesis protein CcmI [Porticoccaceae bacterium]MDG1311144.1 c-type cytochrome biogenesis protein CcmI [Porticoccaceae bacterium]